MAIEVILQGKEKPDDEFAVQCPRCETIFTFQRKDADGKNHESISCPCCGKILERFLWSLNVDFYKKVADQQKE